MIALFFFLLKAIDKIANNQSKTIASHDRSKHHIDAMLMLARRAKEAVLLDFVIRTGSRTVSKVLTQRAKTADWHHKSFMCAWLGATWRR